MYKEIMSNLYRILRSVMPYGLFLYLKKQKNKNVIDVVALLKKYEDYVLNESNRCIFDSESKYNIIVSVQGFGCSGSGAVLDLLREYSSTDVIGYVDTDSSRATNDKTSFEVDLLKHAGGIYEFERYVGTSNIFQMDAMLNRFLLLICESPIFQAFEEIRPLFYEYISEILTYYTFKPSRQYYNTFLDYKGQNNILISKITTISKHREISKKFLTSVFNKFRTNSSKTHLVLDAICGDLEFDDKKNQDYIPNLKSIIVIRDPRDVFTYAMQNDIRWIPTETVSRFINWYKYITSKMPKDNNSDHLIVRFEELICKYETITRKIEQFLNIDSKQHINKFYCLDPQISIKNIGIWKKYPDNIEIYKEIFDNLSFFCYND